MTAGRVAPPPKRRTADPATVPNLLSAIEAAQRIGCSRQHVYNLVDAGHLRAVDISLHGRSRLRIREDDLLTYVTARNTP